MNWNVISAFVLDQALGYQTANKIRENLIVIQSGRRGRFLGGHRILPVFPVLDENNQWESNPPNLGPHDAPDYVDIEIDGTNQGGVTFQARIEVRSRWPTNSITPKIRNVTDNSDAGVGSACTAGNPDYAGTNQKQTIALTIASGIKKYRMQYTLSKLGLGLDCWIIGEIEVFTTS